MAGKQPTKSATQARGQAAFGGFVPKPKALDFMAVQQLRIPREIAEMGIAGATLHLGPDGRVTFREITLLNGSVLEPGTRAFAELRQARVEESRGIRAEARMEIILDLCDGSMDQLILPRKMDLKKVLLASREASNKAWKTLVASLKALNSPTPQGDSDDGKAEEAVPTPEPVGSTSTAPLGSSKSP